VARASVGEYLAQQRRLRGISVDELSELTKIPGRNLERLESGAFDEQPDGFARGFVRTVAEALGLDPDEAVMRLMQEPEADAVPSAAVGRGLVLRLAALSLVVGVVLLAWKLGGAWLAESAEAEPPPPVTYRQDAVGELVRAAETAAPAAPERGQEEQPEPESEPEPTAP
jgi:cytoskeleton protein RodZ